MNDQERELIQIATQLRLLAKEGHGGSEARLVETLAQASRRLQQLADQGLKLRSRRKARWFSVVNVLAVAKLLYDLVAGLGS